MKLLFDLLPALLVFAVFKVADADAAAAARLANAPLQSLGSVGVLGAREAPLLLGGLAGVAAALLRSARLHRRGRGAGGPWLGVVAATALCGAFVWLRGDGDVRWKPSALYWIAGLLLWTSQVFLRRNLTRALLGTRLALPDAAWQRLNAAWVGFFGVMGLMHLWLAYSGSDWLGSTLLGSAGLVLAFVVAQALVLARWLRDDNGPATEPPGLTR